MADTEEKVNKAKALIHNVIETAASIPEGQNELKRNQLRELAALNGTLRDDENQACQNCKLISQPVQPSLTVLGGQIGHRKYDCPEQRNFTANIICRVCGNAGHMARDCPDRQRGSDTRNNIPGGFGGPQRRIGGGDAVDREMEVCSLSVPVELKHFSDTLYRASCRSFLAMLLAMALQVASKLRQLATSGLIRTVVVAGVVTLDHGHASHLVEVRVPAVLLHGSATDRNEITVTANETTATGNGTIPTEMAAHHSHHGNNLAVGMRQEGMELPLVNRQLRRGNNNHLPDRTTALMAVTLATMLKPRTVHLLQVVPLGSAPSCNNTVWLRVLLHHLQM
jgi:hypothetical protein